MSQGTAQTLRITSPRLSRVHSKATSVSEDPDDIAGKVDQLVKISSEPFDTWERVTNKDLIQV